jgi:hypothetical protein
MREVTPKKVSLYASCVGESLTFKRIKEKR